MFILPYAVKHYFNDLVIDSSKQLLGHKLCIIFFFGIMSVIFFIKSQSWCFDNFRVLDKLITNGKFNSHDPALSLLLKLSLI